MLVSLDTAKQHLRVIGTDEDASIALWIGAAEQAAMQYMNRSVYADAPELAAAVLDGTAGVSPMVINDLIKAAILLTLGHLFTNREDVVVGTIATQLDMGSRTLLQPYRVGMGV